MRRLLVPRAQIGADQAVVEGDALHYLARVLRLEVGDALEIFDGEGRAWEGRIDALETERAIVRLGAERSVPTAPPITLAQGLAKGDKLDLVVQKGTELGAARIVPLRLARSIVRLEGAKAVERTRRWQRIADEAARQSGRADVPVVEEPTDLAAFLDGARARGERIAVLWEEERGLRLGAFVASHLDVPLALVIGPEGGLTEGEVATIRAAGGVAVGLGPRILRTETAGLAALSVVLHLAGELG